MWTYKTNASDIDLNNQMGFILCTLYTGIFPIYQHAFIKASENNRYLIYADEKPFYWLGQDSVLQNDRTNQMTHVLVRCS